MIASYLKGAGEYMKKGFTLAEVMIVVAIMGTVISIAVPGYIRFRRTSQAQACQANLQRIDAAKDQWSIDTRADCGTEVTMGELLEPPEEIDVPYLREEPRCPAGGEYSLNPVGTFPECDSHEAGHNMESASLPASQWISD